MVAREETEGRAEYRLEESGGRGRWPVTSRQVRGPNHGDGAGLHPTHGRQRHATAHPTEPQENICNIADLLQLFCGGAESRRWCTWSSLRQRNHDCAHKRCKSSPASMQRRHDWNAALAWMATTAASTEPVVQRMGDWCGFTKHKATHHTTKNTQPKHTNTRGGNTSGDGAQRRVR